MQRFNLIAAVLRTALEEAQTKSLPPGWQQLISLRSFSDAAWTSSWPGELPSLRNNGSAVPAAAVPSPSIRGYATSSWSSDSSRSSNRDSFTRERPSQQPYRPPSRSGSSSGPPSPQGRPRSGDSEGSSRPRLPPQRKDWKPATRGPERRTGFAPGGPRGPASDSFQRGGGSAGGGYSGGGGFIGGGGQRGGEMRPKPAGPPRPPSGGGGQGGQASQGAWRPRPSTQSPQFRNNDRNGGQQHQNQRHAPWRRPNSKFKRRGPAGRGGNFPVKQRAPEIIVIPGDVTVLRLAHLLGVSVPDIEKVLAELGEPARSEEDSLSVDAAELAALELGKPVVMAPGAKKAATASAEAAVPRPAVVAVMGHVDHGKTTLLDALRSTSVAAREAGGITQHVGAFEVSMPGSGTSLTFLDTPGHAAFSAMRARGAAVTDLVVLVVAADDGVMPQTKEALAHARASGCPIVIAITKCDVPAADTERVRRQLLAEGVLLEAVGGAVQAVEVAAPQGLGLVELEEALLLEGEMLELAADPGAPATATVIEAKLDRGQGPMATVIVTGGTLKVGQPVVVGTEWGKVRALTLPGGDSIASNSSEGITPGRPVEIVGLKGVPLAGDELLAVATEERAQRVSKARKSRSEEHRHVAMGKSAAATAAAGVRADAAGIEGPKVLALVIKADVQGSVEAVRQSVAALGTDAVTVQIVHVGVGAVTKSDVALAAPFKAKVVGFNVRAAADAESDAKMNGVGIHCRRVIYELLSDVKDMVAGATPRVLGDVVVGSADVLAVFKVPGKKGSVSRTVAGCRVGDGAMRTGLRVRVLRGGEVVHEGPCESLRRHKLDVETVGKGTECGLGVEGYYDFQLGDQLQCIDQQ